MIQYLINALVAASMWTLVGVGFALIFRVAKFFHFAHGAIFTVGAYSTYLFSVWLHLPLFVAVFGGVLSSVALCLVIECFVYRRLRKGGSQPLVLLLASLGIYIVLQNLISLVFGEATKSISVTEIQEGIEILGGRITPIQILMISTCVALTLVVAVFLRRTKLGRAIRAVADDVELARVSGINSDRVFLSVFAIGSALAGIAGILVALDVNMTPTMGMNTLMMGIVAVIIGGGGSIPGVALGALLLGMAQHLAVWKISSQWQDAIAFVVLLAFLLFKPEGFMGKKIRKATV